MHPVAGIGLIVAGTALGLVTAGVLWPRLRHPAPIALSAIGGVCIAAGGLLVQRDVGLGDWILAIGAIGGIAPIHARVLLGAPGRSR